MADNPEAPARPFEVRRSNFVHTCSNLRAAHESGGCTRKEKYIPGEIQLLQNFIVHSSFSTFLGLFVHRAGFLRLGLVVEELGAHDVHVLLLQ